VGDTPGERKPKSGVPWPPFSGKSLWRKKKADGFGEFTGTSELPAFLNHISQVRYTPAVSNVNGKN
jgi:hypothetical protein